MPAESSLEFTHFHARVVCVWCGMVRFMECLCLASTACAPLRPNRASPCAERAGASVRTARQSEDCLRVRPPRSAIALRKGRSACGGDAARGWHGRVGGSGTARHSATADSAFPAMRNPSANAPCMAWSGYLPASCNAASRRLAHLGAESALAPWSAPPHPARAIRKMSAQALPLAPLDLRHTCASHFIGTSGAPCVPLVSPVPPVSPKARHP